MRWFIFFIPLLTWAQINYELEHENHGCPMNSICSKETGIIRKKFIEKFKNQKTNYKKQFSSLKKFFNKYGLPVSVWATSAKEKKDHLILWQSPCAFHNKRKEVVYQGEIFTKALNRENLQGWALLLDGKNHITRFPVPRDEMPQLVDKNGLVFPLFYEGVYFYLKINRDGKIFLLDKEPKKVEGRKSACPKALVKNFQEHNRFYHSFYCQKIYHLQEKRFQTLLLGFSCP